MRTYAAALLFASVTAGLAQQATLRREVPPEDPKLRAEAVRLLERATMLSSPVWPANEAVDTFRVTRPEPGQPAQGELKISVAAPMLRRWEFTYGAYRFVQVQNGREFATFRTDPNEPAPVTAARKLLPVYLGQFEPADVIQRITDVTLDGQPARCVDFETVKGDEHLPGQVCFDAARGFLILLRQGEAVTRQSAFFQFNDGFLPGHVERWSGGVKLLEIDQKTVVREEYPPDFFEYPRDATIRHMCRAFTRAYEDNTPQPPPKALSDDVIEIRVHGRVGKDGKPTALKAFDTARTDLAAEAVRIVSTWTYHPAKCEYEPATMETDFIVKFKGW